MSSSSFETRFGAAAQAVDAVVAKLRAARVDRNGRLGRRVDALRAHEAELRTRLAGRTDPAVLDRDLDRLTTGTAVVAARLDTELAAAPADFAAAVGAELTARHAQIHSLLDAVAIDALRDGVRRAMAELDDAADEATFTHHPRRSP